MKTMTVGEFKTRFSDVVDWIKQGKKIAVTYGKKKEVIGYFIPELPESDSKRNLGIMKGKAKVSFHPGFKMDEKEFLRQ
jgi:hypothetical protein